MAASPFLLPSFAKWLRWPSSLVGSGEAHRTRHSGAGRGRAAPSQGVAKGQAVGHGHSAPGSKSRTLLTHRWSSDFLRGHPARPSWPGAGAGPAGDRRVYRQLLEPGRRSQGPRGCPPPPPASRLALCTPAARGFHPVLIPKAGGSSSPRPRPATASSGHYRHRCLQGLHWPNQGQNHVQILGDAPSWAGMKRLPPTETIS